MSTKFEDWPPEFSFPPFFTIQPNLETRKRQLEIWATLITNYCKQLKLFILDKNANNLPLFHNADISRQLSILDIQVILEDMAIKGQIEWIDPKTKERFFVFWNSSGEWGHMLYEYAKSNGLLNTVETLQSIINSKTEFRGMDILMLMRIIRGLETEGKAELIGDKGVKFF